MFSGNVDVSKNKCCGYVEPHVFPVRLLFLLEHEPPFQEIIDAGIIPDFVAFLKREKEPVLQFEAAWALTNGTCVFCGVET